MAHGSAGCASMAPLSTWLLGRPKGVFTHGRSCEVQTGVVKTLPWGQHQDMKDLPDWPSHLPPSTASHTEDYNSHMRIVWDLMGTYIQTISLGFVSKAKYI